MTDAIIVGAGAAGLMAARVLTRAGKKVIVLEASNRIGGRVMTLEGTLAGIPVELGAEFIHGDAPETRKLLEEARLVTVPVTGDHYRSDDGELSPQGPVWKRMAKVFSYMNADRKIDRSFQDFLDDKPGGRSLARERQLAFGFVQGFNGADVRLISEKSLAEQGNPTEGAAEAARIVNGYSALIDFIARDVSNLIRRGSRVVRVAWSSDGVSATTEKGEAFEAPAIIITVPLPALQDDSIVFDPDIPAIRNAAQKLVMGHVAHVSVIVKERFWEKKVENVSFVHSPERPFNVWWTQNPLLAPLLVGWAGGPPARELMESANVEDVAMSELARTFATTRRRIEALVDSIHFHDWSNDPDIRGAYSYVGVGGGAAARTLARTFENRIYLAGEATESSSSGTVEGAISSGIRAAERLLNSSR
ncbi:MAG TPA: NAD(P)/FAD-dependent oxidoreductase [Gemmatimonadaceae bacterium]